MLYSKCGREVSRDDPRPFLLGPEGAEYLRMPPEGQLNEVEKNSA